jgi:hypothetical protein
VIFHSHDIQDQQEFFVDIDLNENNSPLFITSYHLDPSIYSNIRFIRFSTFKQFHRFPRFPEDSSHTLSLSEMTLEDYENHLIIFISHCWLRKNYKEAGWNGRAHPDNRFHSKHSLIVKGIEKILVEYTERLKDCYLWIDFSCLSQENRHLPSSPSLSPSSSSSSSSLQELKHFDQLIYLTDIIFTPLYDTDTSLFSCWPEPLKLMEDPFTEYPSTSWKEYLSRGWCRLEMLYASAIPLFDSYNNENRKLRMKSDLRYSRYGNGNSRLHFLYGTKEDQRHEIPLFIPSSASPFSFVSSSLLPTSCHSNNHNNNNNNNNNNLMGGASSTLLRYHPCQGNVTISEDCHRIEQLLAYLRPYLNDSTIQLLFPRKKSKDRTKSKERTKSSSAAASASSVTKKLIEAASGGNGNEKGKPPRVTIVEEGDDEDGDEEEEDAFNDDSNGWKHKKGGNGFPTSKNSHHYSWSYETAKESSCFSQSQEHPQSSLDDLEEIGLIN